MSDVSHIVIPETFHIELLSAATFAASGRLSGDVDIETALDESGLPMIGGKTIGGLLSESWWEMNDVFASLRPAGHDLFPAASDNNESGFLSIGNAHVDPTTRSWFAALLADGDVTRNEIVEAFTEVVAQTAVSRETGAPEPGSLRRSRGVTRGVVLHAPLTWLTAPRPDHLEVLARATLSLRRGGVARTRGRGLVRCWLAPDRTNTLKLAQVAL